MIENWKFKAINLMHFKTPRPIFIYSPLLIIFARLLSRSLLPLPDRLKLNERTSLFINLFFNGFIMRSG